MSRSAGRVYSVEPEDVSRTCRELAVARQESRVGEELLLKAWRGLVKDF